jgi:adenylosuccinate lyase
MHPALAPLEPQGPAGQQLQMPPQQRLSPLAGAAITELAPALPVYQYAAAAMAGAVGTAAGEAALAAALPAPPPLPEVAAAGDGGRALHAALRGDAAPSSSSEDRALAAAAALAAGLVPSPQKTTATAAGGAEAEAGAAVAVAGTQSPVQQPYPQGRLPHPGNGSAPAANLLPFAFPQLQPLSQEGPAPTPPSLLPAELHAPHQGPGIGSGIGGGAAAAAQPLALAASPEAVGKENLTSSQSNSQEQLPALLPCVGGTDAALPAAAGSGKPVASQKLAPSEEGWAAAAAAAVAGVPDTEEQALPGTQPLGSQPYTGTEGAAALAAPAAADAAGPAALAGFEQPESQQRSSQRGLATAVATAAAAAAAEAPAGGASTQGKFSAALLLLL